MADPLTAVADQYAPAPLNFFDAGAAESVISKYANTRRGLAATDAALGVAARAQGMQAQALNMQADRERMEHDNILADRDDLEYQEKQAVKADKRELLKSIMQMDHTSPDFITKQLDFLKNAPPSILENDVIKTSLQAKAALNNDWRTEQNRVADDTRTMERDKARFAEKEKSDKLLANLTEEDRKNLPRDMDGGIDMIAAYRVALQRENESKLKMDAAKVDKRVEARKELLDIEKMDDKQKAVFRELELRTIKDPEAFPRATDKVRQEAIAAGASPAIVNNPEMLRKYPKFGPKFQEAEELDRNQIATQVNAAKRFKSADEYVASLGKASPEAEKARHNLYAYAHQNDEVDAAPETTKAAPKAGTPREEVVWKNGKPYRRRWVEE